MDGMILLREARLAGLSVTTDGHHVTVRGPRNLEPVAMTLLAEKSGVLAALLREREIAWRSQVMQDQVPAVGAIPLLIARPGIPFLSGSCCSCGDPLAPDERYRCSPCVAAAVAVLGAAP